MPNRLVGLIALTALLVALIAVPLGRYIARVFRGEHGALGRLFVPVEKKILALAGVREDQEHDWRGYAGALLAFSLVTLLFTYALLRLQGAIGSGSNHFSAVPPWLAFNTAVSFTTNTNWQSYAGETTMGPVAQAVALTSHNFFSAAVGLCVAIALLRGIARKQNDARGASTLGNAWVDLIRAHLYILVPLSLAYAIFLVSQGVVQTLGGVASWTTIDGGHQSLMLGPVASQEAIKMLGTNGGGFFNANSAHPFENPSALTDLSQIVAMLAIPAALCVTAGEIVGHRKHGYALLVAMALLCVASVVAIGHFEHVGNPALTALGVDPAMGNMEGKETRFGIAESALFSAVTTDVSCGAVNTMHDSLMPLSGLATLLNIQLGEIVFGGVGSGLYGMLVFVVLTVFLSGLMIGRTPEYLGKKIDSRDVRLASFYVLIPAVAILVLTGLALATDVGRGGILNTSTKDVPGAPWHPHPHGLSEVLYAYTSAVGNNGSAFGGLTAYSTDHPIFYSVTLGVGMMIGRFLPMIAVLALAGNMASKRRVPEGPGSFPIAGPLFVALLCGTILLVGALTFFPILSFGPIVEHLSLATVR